MRAAGEDPLLVSMLAPATGEESLDSVLRLCETFGEPFSVGRCQTLARLSKLILHDFRLRSDAASVALAYWLRRSNIDRLAQAFESRKKAEPNTVFVPAGRVYHVAPGNVDTVFVYSWALSYLCGNQNIVRVSGQKNEILSGLLAQLARLMQDDMELAENNRFLTYEHNQAISEALSLWATHRVLWGGDDSVRMLRSLPLSPHASERAFGSKFSYSVISARAYLEADAQTVERLAAGFFNDIFWFDQMACSSPHLVVWVAAAEMMDPALERFHQALAKQIEDRGYHGSPSAAIHRLNFVFEMACDKDLRTSLEHKEFLAVRLPEAAPWPRDICGAGLFTHVRADQLLQVSQFAGERDQTITHFGFSREELRALAERAGSKGVDRLVPVGEALAFDVIWDGYDLIGDFLRHVTLRMGDS